jgi:hypothetical protein
VSETTVIMLSDDQMHALDNLDPTSGTGAARERKLW